MSAIEVIKKIAEEEVKKFHLIELGIVTSVFPHSSSDDSDNYECSVRLEARDGCEVRHVPIATQQIGLVSTPNVGDLVVIGFINGDPNAPVVIGRLYSDEDRPPVSQKNEFVYEPPHSKEKGVRRFHLKFPNSFSFTITDEDVKIEAGSTKVTINTDGQVRIDSNKDINIKAAGALNLSAQNIKLDAQQDVTIQANQNLSLNSNQKAELKGINIEVNGTTGTKIQGMNTEIKGDMNVNIDAGMEAKVKANLSASLEGSVMAEVKGGAMAKVQGGVVMIN